MLNLTTKPFAVRTLHSLLIQMQNIRLRSSGMRRKQNFEIFAFLLFFCSSFLIFFSLAGHLVGFILVGKVFRKAFRILGLDERKGMWVVEQNFHGNFQLNVTWFFAFFPGVLDLIVPILVWLERSRKSAIVSGQSCLWLLKLMMSQAVERTWIPMGSYRQLRGEWVNGWLQNSPFQKMLKQ